jgi:hypothetical protein
VRGCPPQVKIPEQYSPGRQLPESQDTPQDLSTTTAKKHLEFNNNQIEVEKK